jgi:hypothetical protein
VVAIKAFAILARGKLYDLKISRGQYYVYTSDRSNVLSVLTSESVEMDKFFLSINNRILLPVVFLGGIVVWFFLCEAHYQSYWNATIYRVQTTDFNLLHHTLPATLSQLIIAGRDDEVQNVLDSTFGIFGLVVTDPSGESILYKTNKVYHRKSWQSKATPEGLLLEGKKEPFDVLTDPPPLEPVWQHESPRAEAAVRDENASNAGSRVIGHLYYVRPDPPPFLEDITGFITTDPRELSGAKRGYLFITLTTIGFGLVVILLVLLRQRMVEMRQIELNHTQRELDIRKKALEHLSAELVAQKSRKTWLEREADDSYKRALHLKQSLEKLRDSLALVNANTPERQSGETSQSIKIRPAVHPPSALLEEIEQLIPALTDNAGSLKSQATLLHDYCAILEQRQTEMKNIVENAYTKAQQIPENVLDMSPR